MSIGEIRATDAPVDDPYGEDYHAKKEAEDRERRDWWSLEAHCREFIEEYGVSALLRCASRALDAQRELIDK